MDERTLLQHTILRWRYAYWINIVTNILAFFAFTTFGSAKIQPWNYPPTEVENWEEEQQQQETQQQETKT